MPKASHAWWLLAVVVMAVPPLPLRALASHTTFSAAVERFEADGNVFGSLGGTLDLVDEFDDETLAPNWVLLLGTAIEADGVLTLRDPGVDIDLVPGITLDISNVESVAAVENGGGDFTLTSYWRPTPLGPNAQIHFQIYGDSPVIESAGLTVINPGGEFTDYRITQDQLVLFGGGAQHDEVVIDPADITGEIVLRLVFDDAADTLTCSFSLDGGYTFQSPFSPLHVFTATSDGEILLGADTATPPEPPPPPPPISPICSPGAAITDAKLNVAGRRGGGSRLSFTGRLLVGSGFPVSFDPARDGAQVLLMDVVTQTRFFDLSAPVSIPAGGRGDGCDPRDGWKTVRGSSSTSYIYRNYSNALPPACTPESAQGLRILSFTDARTSKGKLSVSLAAPSAQPYLYVGDQLRGTVVFGGTAAAGMNGQCGIATVYCRARPRAKRCGD